MEKKITFLIVHLLILSMILVIISLINAQANNSNWIIIYGNDAATTDHDTATIISGSFIKSTNIKFVKDINFVDDGVSSIISVGGSCVNTYSAGILGVSYKTCGDAFSSATNVNSGQFIYKTAALSNKRIAILIAGYDGIDTVNSEKYLETQSVNSLQPGIVFIGEKQNIQTQTHQTHNININNFAFIPPSLSINTGDTVIWTNMDSVAHTVTSDSGTELNSATLQTGSTYSHTFNNPGTFNYHCSIHTSMKGSITVS